MWLAGSRLVREKDRLREPPKEWVDVYVEAESLKLITMTLLRIPVMLTFVAGICDKPNSMCSRLCLIDGVELDVWLFYPILSCLVPS